MRARLFERALWALTALVALTAAIVMRPRRTPERPSVLVSLRRTAGSAAASDAMRAGERIADILAGDVFRRERQPAGSPWATGQSQNTVGRVPSPPKPRLVLRGLVGGPPWDAVLDGLPGHEGSYVVRAGDSIAGLRIRSVRADGAIIRGLDTTWVLKWSRKP